MALNLARCRGRGGQNAAHFGRRLALCYAERNHEATDQHDYIGRE